LQTIGVEKNKGLMSHRGVDFREVAAVINLSSPYSIKKYIHRIGRTARAGHYGVAITLVTPREMRRFRYILLCRVRGPVLTTANKEDSVKGMDVDSEIIANLPEKTSQQMNKELLSEIIQKLPLSMNDLQPFRYRCESVRCSITTQLVRHARLNELKMEVLNSKRLQSHFKERRREYELLRHDKMLQPAEMVRPHLSHVSSYLISDTNLKPPKHWTNANHEYKRVFGVMPPRVRENRVKKALRKKNET